LISEIWFPRNSVFHKAYGKIAAPSYPETEYDDLSERLVRSNGLSDFRRKFFSFEENRQVFEILERSSSRAFIMPSTGFFAFHHVLNDPEFRAFNKYMLGFQFRGWSGHPWAAEKDLVMSFVSSGDLHFIDNRLKSFFFAAKHKRQIRTTIERQKQRKQK
jgi:hypothetical protein